VKSVYYRELIKQLPDSVDDSGTVEALVVIAKDGKVVSSRITRRSGVAAADRAVQNTLNNVRFAAPLPPTEKSGQREVTINFNISAIRQLLG
jgi:TonB family protein